MKIRTRLTLWYATILVVSLLIIGIGTYYQISELFQREKNHEPAENPFGETDEMIFEIGLPAILFGLLGGWWITRSALAPVTQLTKAVEKIHESNLHEQLPRAKNGDELDRLTEVFNAMTLRLDDSFQHIREFTLHASHELKTPLTVLRGELETALREENLTTIQKERHLSQIDEIERLAKIVDGLTLLTKADAGQIKLNFESVRLDELVRENLADAKILAQSQNIQVNLCACDEVTIYADRHRLRQLLLNLTDNAVKYNWSNGTVNFSLSRMNGFAILKIENTSEGVAPELQSRVFERFFRGDTSHNNSIEGCGLGLSIAQWIATAHGSQIQFVSEPGKSTNVTVRLCCANE
ncbi:MAG TPA: ATP-binding protein [Verrucomicrobiae bacterium]|nr:ATP-binding protein [Verrucomicrobiae bacterium]